MYTTKHVVTNEPGVWLMMNNKVYPANSYIDIRHVQEDRSNALMCVTAKRPCCTSVSSNFGWYYPPGGPGRVSAHRSTGQNFYVTKSNEGMISLHRRNTALTPSGKFCCTLADENNDVHSVCAHLSESITTCVYTHLAIKFAYLFWHAKKKCMGLSTT